MQESDKPQNPDMKEKAIEIYKLGIKYYEDGNFSEAIEFCQQALEINPHLKLAWQMLGDSFRELKKYSKSIEAFEKLIELDKDFAASWLSLGIVYHAMRDYQKAIECGEGAIEASKTEDEIMRSVNKILYKELVAYQMLAWSYQNLKDYSNAVIQWEKVIEIDPNHATGWSELGFCYIEIDKYSEAVKALKKALKLDPNDPDSPRIRKNLKIAKKRKKY